jgi:hypothetical protein
MHWESRVGFRKEANSVTGIVWFGSCVVWLVAKSAKSLPNSEQHTRIMRTSRRRSYRGFSNMVNTG